MQRIFSWASRCPYFLMGVPLPGLGVPLPGRPPAHYMEPHVLILRELRDSFMLTNEAGREFVDFYYRHSPAHGRYYNKVRTTQIADPCIIDAISWNQLYCALHNTHATGHVYLPDSDSGIGRMPVCQETSALLR